MWFENDKFYNKLSELDKLAILEEVIGRPQSHDQYLKCSVWHGSIQNCPTCKEKRITDCCACGCGCCYTCGYRFTCMPPLTTQHWELPENFIITDVLPKWRNYEIDYK